MVEQKGHTFVNLHNVM